MQVWKAYLLIFFSIAVALVLSYISDTFYPYEPGTLMGGWDHRYYVPMAFHPFSRVDPLALEAPFCWRVLTPLLVYLSPLQWTSSFLLISIIGIGGSALVLYFYIMAKNKSEGQALLGIALFFTLNGVIFDLQNIFMPDPIALLIIGLGFYFIEIHKWRLPIQRGFKPVFSPLFAILLGLMLIGAADKETVLALIPLILLTKNLNWLEKVLLIILPIALIGIIRLVIQPVNEYSLLTEITEVYKEELGSFEKILKRLNFAFLGSWGPALLVLLYRPRNTISYVLEHKPQFLYLALIYSQLIFAFNVNRLMIDGYIVVLPLVVLKAEELARELKIDFRLFSGILITTQLLYFYGRLPIWLTLVLLMLLIAAIFRSKLVFLVKA